MSRFFDPLEYMMLSEPAINAEPGQRTISGEAAQTLQEMVGQIRGYLRREHEQGISAAVIDPQIRQRLQREILNYITDHRLQIPAMTQRQLLEGIQQEILYFGPIQKALDDPEVTNIDINNFLDIFLERRGVEEYHPEMGFQSETHLEVMINKMLLNDGKVLTANEPHVDSLFEKYRICAVLGTSRGGIASGGTCASIRKFAEDTLTPADLVKNGTMSLEMNAFFEQVLPWCNGIIAGATNSGKTTTLMALPLYFETNTRIITIEDSPEMMLHRRKRYQGYHNIVSLQGKDHENKEKRFDIARLTKVSLRMRPVKVLIGEVRDAQSCRQAHESMNTGHSTYFTIHASSARNAAVRIVQLAGDGYNDEVIASQLADTVDLIIFQQKMGKSRIITEVVELLEYEKARKPVCSTLFRFEQLGINKEGFVQGIHHRENGISRGLAEKLAQMMVPDKQIMHWSSPGNRVCKMKDKEGGYD